MFVKGTNPGTYLQNKLYYLVRQTGNHFLKLPCFYTNLSLFTF
jgi:hypothetical protein